MECVGMLIEQDPNDGYCELGDECTALPLLEVSYSAFREAHHNRSGGRETGGEG
jgi:hypothetical protein